MKTLKENLGKNFIMFTWEKYDTKPKEKFQFYKKLIFFFLKDTYMNDKHQTYVKSAGL